MINKCRMALLFIVILFLCQLISGCIPPPPPPPEEKPVVILTNSRGQKAAEFAVLDAIFGSFSQLLPDTRYDIQVMRSDGLEISHSSYTSDKRGVIPTAALWWDVGVEYQKSRVGKLNLGTLFQYTYSCLIKRDNRTIVEIPIRIQPIEETGPIIYSTNENGDPLNGFVHQKESVYLTGKNFPPGCALHIYVVRDRYAWEVGDRLDPVLDKALVLQLDEGQQDFTTLIWSSESTEIGSYDFIVEYAAQNGVFDHEDLADNIYGVGFTVFWLSPPSPPAPPPAHIETDLACQAPPQDPKTGAVLGAPNPVYKDYFAPEEEVWVAVNPHVSGHDFVWKKARLYVVNHKKEVDWKDGTSLKKQDVSGGYEKTIIQPGCANVNYNRVWKKPDIGEYDVVVDFKPFGVYNKGKDIIDKLDKKGFVVPKLWVCLESVSLNHNSTSSASDALNIRKNYTQAVVIPEWQKAKKSYPAAYIKKKNITVKAVFSAATGVKKAQIRAAVGAGSLGSINQKTVSFSGGKSGPVIFQVATLTPNEVKYFYQKWKWYCKNVDGTGSPEVHIGDSQNKIFIVLAEPKSPWNTNIQTQPWADALAKSCSWAFGEATPADATEEITQHLFNNVGGKYDSKEGAPKYDDYGNFKATEFLNHIPSVSTVNCYDMGRSLVTFANVVGCGLSYRFSSPFGYLNCIKAIGGVWTNNPFYKYKGKYMKVNPNPIVKEDWTENDGRSRFGNHAFGSISDHIFDACLKVDTDSNPDAPPHQIESWMTNQPWNTYKKKVVDDKPKTNTGYPATHSFGIK